MYTKLKLSMVLIVLLVTMVGGQATAQEATVCTELQTRVDTDGQVWIEDYFVTAYDLQVTELEVMITGYLKVIANNYLMVTRDKVTNAALPVSFALPFGEQRVTAATAIVDNKGRFYKWLYVDESDPNNIREQGTGEILYYGPAPIVDLQVFQDPESGSWFLLALDENMVLAVDEMLQVPTAVENWYDFELSENLQFVSDVVGIRPVFPETGWEEFTSLAWTNDMNSVHPSRLTGAWWMSPEGVQYSRYAPVIYTPEGHNVVRVNWQVDGSTREFLHDEVINDLMHNGLFPQSGCFRNTLLEGTGAL